MEQHRPETRLGYCKAVKLQIDRRGDQDQKAEKQKEPGDSNTRLLERPFAQTPARTDAERYEARRQMVRRRLAIHAMERKADEPPDPHEAICKVLGATQYTAQEVPLPPPHLRDASAVKRNEHQERGIETRTLAAIDDEQIRPRSTRCRRESRQHL